jgi:hypothetical protein
MTTVVPSARRRNVFPQPRLLVPLASLTGEA